MLFTASILVYFFFEIVDDVFSDPLEGDMESHEFDTAVAQFFMQFRTEKLTQIAIDLTALGSVSVLSVFGLLAYAAIIGRRDFLGFLHLSIALLGALVWPVILKPYFGRDRPALIDQLVVVGDLSFPSGHAFGAAAAYATLAFFCARFTQSHAAEVFSYLFALTLIVVIGVTRIYLGVHYTTDVLAGLSAGGAWAFFVAAGFSMLYKKQPAHTQ
ncbi:MAG: phosphatase PAP2 family protein [Pseudomonadota bacterium]